MNVNWKPAVGLENRFMVSDSGLVKSVTSKYRPKSLILKPYGKRYLFVSYLVDGKGHKCTVHRMVAKAFIPNPENKRCVNHKNGNKTDNHVLNLEWATHQENSKHAYLNKLTNIKPRYGVEHPLAKLNPEKVQQIRSKYRPRIYSQRRLAKEYGVDQGTILSILKNRTWVG